MQCSQCSACHGMHCRLLACFRRTQGQRLHVSKAPHLSCRCTSSRLHLAGELLAQLLDLTVQVLPTLLGTVQLLPVFELKPLHVPAQGA